jgi:hypothetical protein
MLAVLPARADEPSGEGTPEATAEASEALDEDAEAMSPWEEIGGKVFDALVLRPFGAGAAVVGMAGFLISVPLTAPGGNIANSWDLFVMSPFDYTFVRPLGDF